MHAYRGIFHSLKYVHVLNSDAQQIAAFKNDTISCSAVSKVPVQIEAMYVLNLWPCLCFAMLLLACVLCLPFKFLQYMLYYNLLCILFF